MEFWIHLMIAAMPLLLFYWMARRLIRFSQLIRNPDQFAGALSQDLKQKLEAAGVDLRNARFEIRTSGGDRFDSLPQGGAGASPGENPLAAQLVRKALLAALTSDAAPTFDAAIREAAGKDRTRGGRTAPALDMPAGAANDQHPVQRGASMASPRLPSAIDAGSSGVARAVGFVVLAAIAGLSLSLWLQP